MPADKGRKQKVKSTKKLRLFGGQRADWVQNSHNSRQTQWAGVEAKSPGSQGLLRRKMPSNPCFKGHIHVPIIMHVIVQLMCLLFKSVFHFEKKIIFYILIIRNLSSNVSTKKRILSAYNNVHHIFSWAQLSGSAAGLSQDGSLHSCQWIYVWSEHRHSTLLAHVKYSAWYC